MKKYYQAKASPKKYSTSACCQRLPLFLSIFQCFIIAGIIFSPSYFSPILNIRSKIVDRFPRFRDSHESSKSTQATNSKSSVSDGSVGTIAHEKLEGVAVTVFLHGPRWFQTRYTMMVQNVLANLPKNWKVQIFTTGKPDAGLGYNLGLQRLISAGVVELTQLPSSLVKLKKKELLTHEWLWENMLADRVLMFGGNSAMCGNTAHKFEDFSGYDWIGAPWHHFSGRGGDGGISFRSRLVMLQVIRRELSKHGEAERAAAKKKWGYEDQFFVSRLLEMEKEGMQFNIADKNSTLKFAASGSHAPEGVFAASMTLSSADYDTRDKFLSYCLELKMIFPSLHDPNCFGAQPNPALCKESICALQEPLVGGC